MIRGIDVSHHNGSIDWAKVKASGIDFAFVKASQGKSFIDPMFFKNFSAAQNAGLLVGAYHFFDPLIDPVAQANRFLDLLKPFSRPFMVALDLEWAKGGGATEPWDALTAQQRNEKVNACLDAIQEPLRTKPFVYTCAPFHNEYLISLALGYYPLWLARYAKTLPAGWSNSHIWQYGEDGTCPGITGPVDLDRSELSLAELTELAVKV